LHIIASRNAFRIIHGVVYTKKSQLKQISICMHLTSGSDGVLKGMYRT